MQHRGEVMLVRAVADDCAEHRGVGAQSSTFRPVDPGTQQGIVDLEVLAEQNRFAVPLNDRQPILVW